MGSIAGQEHRPLAERACDAVMDVELRRPSEFFDPRSGGATLIEDVLNEVDVDDLGGLSTVASTRRWLSGNGPLTTIPAGEKKFCTSSKGSGQSARASARVKDWS